MILLLLGVFLLTLVVFRQEAIEITQIVLIRWNRFYQQSRFQRSWEAYKRFVNYTSDQRPEPRFRSTVYPE
jgi:hypothetical protein